jgi:hypothetical protein
MKELSVIQKTYDCIKWYVPIIERLPKIHKFTLGDRIINQLYDLLEGLIQAKYAKNKLSQLESLNSKLDILRYQTRMMLDFNKMSVERYEYAFGVRVVCAVGRTLYRESWQVGICQECNRRVQPTPVMSVTISKNKTGLGSLVGENRRLAQPP